MYNYQLMTRFGVDPDHDADTGFFFKFNKCFTTAGKGEIVRIFRDQR